MPVSAINELPTPTDDSLNLPPIHFQALAAQLDTRLIPRFATLTARDNAITSPVNGMSCWCDSPGSFYDRIAGAWVPRPISVYNTVALDNTAVPNTARLVRLERSVLATVSNTAGGVAVTFGFTFTKLISVRMAPGDVAADVTTVVPIAGNHTLTAANGQARRSDGTAVPQGSVIRVELTAIGYIL